MHGGDGPLFPASATPRLFGSSLCLLPPPHRPAIPARPHRRGVRRNSREGPVLQWPWPSPQEEWAPIGRCALRCAPIARHIWPDWLCVCVPVTLPSPHSLFSALLYSPNRRALRREGPLLLTQCPFRQDEMLQALGLRLACVSGSTTQVGTDDHNGVPVLVGPPSCLPASLALSPTLLCSGEGRKRGGTGACALANLPHPTFPSPPAIGADSVPNIAYCYLSSLILALSHPFSPLLLLSKPHQVKIWVYNLFVHFFFLLCQLPCSLEPGALLLNSARHPCCNAAKDNHREQQQFFFF